MSSNDGEASAGQMRPDKEEEHEEEPDTGHDDGRMPARSQYQGPPAWIMMLIAVVVVVGASSAQLCVRRVHIMEVLRDTNAAKCDMYSYAQKQQSMVEAESITHKQARLMHKLCPKIVLALNTSRDWDWKRSLTVGPLRLSHTVLGDVCPRHDDIPWADDIPITWAAELNMWKSIIPFANTTEDDNVSMVPGFPCPSYELKKRVDLVIE